MYTQAMATKTISVDLEAYERLRRARLSLEEAPPPVPAVLDRLDEAQRSDLPPEDPRRSD